MDYSKYKFNYFDVVKRHERIINRPKDWEVKVLACIMLFVTFCYVFSSGVFATEQEDVQFNSVSGITISPNRNYFYSASSSTGYFEIESGYIYHILNNTTESNRNLAVSSSIPELNGTYTFLATLGPGETYDYIGNGGYFYFDFSPSFNVIVTREKMANYEGAVNDLVDNVGINQMWGVFENGIDFVGVVVLVAFGLFLVVLAIKKVSKGKSEF